VSMTTTVVASHDGDMADHDPARPRRRSSARSTSWRSWPSTTGSPSLVTRARCCDARPVHPHIVEWRRAREAGALAGLAAQGRRPRRSAEQVELERVRRRNQRLEADLARTRAALEIVGKAHALLEQLSESADSEPRSSR
jgi:hypothetical protein